MNTDVKKARRIEANKQLQMKVGAGAIDEATIKRAQKVIDENVVDFAPIARPYLNELRDRVAIIMNSGDFENIDLDLLTKPIMNIKANAGSFQYQLVSDMTGSVLLLLEGLKKTDKKAVQIVDLLHKTVLLIIAKEMKGDGGKDGQALKMAFEELCESY